MLIILFEINPSKDDKNGNWKSWKTGGIGNGVYPSLALLNHSCAKNVTKYYDGSTVVVVASRHIFKGILEKSRSNS
jgi:hypothetical protein